MDEETKRIVVQQSQLIAEIMVKETSVSNLLLKKGIITSEELALEMKESAERFNLLLKERLNSEQAKKEMVDES